MSTHLRNPDRHLRHLNRPLAAGLGLLGLLLGLVSTASPASAAFLRRRRPRCRNTVGRHPRRLLHLRGGRPLGRRLQRRLPARRRARLARLPRQPQRHRRDHRPLPSGVDRRGPHRRRRQRPQPRLQRGQDRHLDRHELQARHRLLHRLGRQGSGAHAPGGRRRQERAHGRGLDRRERLRVRELRPVLRGQLPHLAVLVEELLPRRRLASRRTSPPRTSPPSGPGLWERSATSRRR